MSGSGNKKAWNFVKNFAGDKVVLIITLMLILISIVCIFSSSSRLVTEETSRLDIAIDQLKTVGLGLFCIFICYQIRWIGVYRVVSAFGFLISFVFLLILDIGGIGSIAAPRINGAVRFLMIGGFQIHIFEIVKVAMVMYIAWAIDTIKKDNFRLLNKLSELEHMHWLSSKWAKKIIYLYIPLIIVTLMVAKGSNSAALMVAGILIIVIAIGLGEAKEFLLLLAVGVSIALGCFGLYSATKDNEHPMFERIGTAVSRMLPHDYVTDFKNAETTSEKQKALDKLRQPYSARIAIKQGGLLGKGPGQSTQRYVVPDMSEDYMFSFILEEYGWLGGMVVIALYLSLMARGVLIVRSCGSNVFAQCAVMGLVLLISGQAMLHILNNARINTLTGQTLPLISRGASAFICFSIAFGIILAISRISNRNIERQTVKSTPLIDLGDPVQEGLSDLQTFEDDDTI